MSYSKICIYCHVVTLEGYNAEQRKFYEQGTTQLHTRERCAEARSKAGLPAHTVTPSPPQPQRSTIEDQKSKDIKNAQKERRDQHRELIKNLQWNTKMLAHLVEAQTGKEARDILDSMGFEEFQEEQRNYPE